MALNPQLAELSEFPFARLQSLLAGIVPARDGLDLSIGDPKGAPPASIDAALQRHSDAWRSYPPPQGTPELRASIARWLARRFAVEIDPATEILPVAGTKEALYLLSSLVVGGKGPGKPAILIPNPLYQVYYGAAVMAGAEPVAVPATEASGFLPDLDWIAPEVWERAAAFYLCSPSNPQGAVADRDYWVRALDLCRANDCVLIADECYSELYRTTAPTGALTAAIQSDRGLEGLIALNSLSKRSNAAGLRVGMAAGDAAILGPFLKMRRYGAATIPLPVQAAAVELFNDEEHVSAIRTVYSAKFGVAERNLGRHFAGLVPPAGFFLWLDVADGEAFVRDLFAATGIKALPGAYLSAPSGPEGRTPGDRFVRLALVHDLASTETALGAIADFLNHR